MHKLLAAGGLLLAMTSNASALETWQGHLFVIATSGTCDNDPTGIPITKNQFFTAIFRPRNLEDNGPDTYLSLVSQRGANSYKFANKALTGSGSVSYTGVSTKGHTYTLTTTYSGASVAPAAPTVNTQTVVVTITIANVTGYNGCTATLKGSLGNRPNL